jgi:indolepyruvate decarboxylase
MPQPNPTVADYLVARLAAAGVAHAFGVPGDYAFPVNDAFESSEEITSVGCSNELNAAYAADGYARIVGLAVLSTTYGVGELSAINGVMGSKAEHVPVIHIVGQPAVRLQRSQRVIHHTLGGLDYDTFQSISAQAACVSVDLTPENAIAEIERVIDKVIRDSQPGYVSLAQDLAKMPVVGDLPEPRHLTQHRGMTSSSSEMAAAIAAIESKLGAAKRPVAKLSYQVQRRGLPVEAESFLTKANIPFVTAPMDKGVNSESHELFHGMYFGQESQDAVNELVEQADLLIDIGGVSNVAANTGRWSHRVDPGATISLFPDYVHVCGSTFGPIHLQNILRELAKVTPTFETPSPVEPRPQLEMDGTAQDHICLRSFLPRFQRFLTEGDILVTETGYSSNRMVSRLGIPHGAEYHNQVLWGSIGWATPAAFGTSLAAPERRTILVTGDGAHMLTATEIGAMGFHGTKPIIFVMNNETYGVEELLSVETGHEYNDLPPWRFAELPRTLGCDGWLNARIETVGQLDEAQALATRSDTAAYLEIVLGKEAVPGNLPHKALQDLYEVDPH